MKLISVIAIFFAAVALLGPAWAAEYIAAWRYTPPMGPAVVGFRLWRGADPNTPVAEFPGWARGGRWTQDELIASGEALTYTVVFADATESPRSAAYVYPMGDGTTGIRHARFKAGDGAAAAPLTKQNGARLR